MSVTVPVSPAVTTIGIGWPRDPRPGNPPITISRTDVIARLPNVTGVHRCYRCIDGRHYDRGRWCRHDHGWRGRRRDDHRGRDDYRCGYANPNLH